MMSNPYAIMRTDGKVHSDNRGQFYEINGRFFEIQRLDDGRRVYTDGTNWFDVDTQQPIGRANQRSTQHTHTRHHQAAPQPASQQHAAQKQQNHQELAQLQHHHRTLAQSVRQLEHHVQQNDTVTDHNVQALSQQIAEVQKNLDAMGKHVDKMVKKITADFYHHGFT